MKYYVIAGEASGDLHGSNLIKEIKKLDPQAIFRGWGGELLQSSGMELIKHYRDLAFMGFIEVIANLPAIIKNFSSCKEDILLFQPDVVVLIDYPGFNLRMAKWAKKKGFKIAYYISPQVWAWKEGRVKSIKKYVDQMLVILPFEKDFYSKWNYNVHYVGHPLAEVVNEFLKIHDKKYVPGKPIIALLPGSRRQEISMKLPLMLEASRAFPAYDFMVAKAPGVPNEFYRVFLDRYPAVGSAENDTYGLLSKATAALVTSGTATLETALFNVPQVVCYKGSSISFAIAKRLVKIKYISLVNLIMDKAVVTELIQDDLTTEHIVHELDKVLHNQEKIDQIHKDYKDLLNLIVNGGHASEAAAEKIVKLASENLHP